MATPVAGTEKDREAEWQSEETRSVRWNCDSLASAKTMVEACSVGGDQIRQVELRQMEVAVQDDVVGAPDVGGDEIRQVGFRLPLVPGRRECATSASRTPTSRSRACSPSSSATTSG